MQTDVELLEHEVSIDLRGRCPVLNFRDLTIDLIDTPVPKSDRVRVRILDLLITLPVAIVAVPVMLVLSIIVACTSRGPVFYRSHRETSNGDVFSMWKFRTMVADADEVLQQYFADNPDAKELFERNNKFKRDPRVTRVGRVLRRLSLDELPQLWNVIRGDMSVVGPRPRFDWESERFGSALPTVERVKGGLTGAWQVSGRSDLTFEERLAIEVKYATTRSIRHDLKIIAKTALQMLKGSPGAY